MQISGRFAHGTAVLTTTALLAFSGTLQAQEAPQAPVSAGPATSSPKPALTPEQQALAKDFYRAEIVIIERMVEPDEVEERMAGRLPEPPELGADRILRHTEENGETLTTLELVPRQELHLNNAAKRLSQSGNYRVLLAEGWYQAFPPDFEGEPLWVTVGDWLPGAGHTDVQGQITIERQRYLHVDVQLNHWLPKPPTENLLGIDLDAETPSRPPLPPIPLRPAGLEQAPGDTPDSEPQPAGEQAPEGPGNMELPERTLVAGLDWPRQAELLTWIRETRRMRSEEVHFLDSPTLGVLLFFKKIEPEDAAPLILKLGLTGKPEPPEGS